VIVATPTGSTAYSLAASGPIVYPTLSVILLAPICPHTLAQRPVLLDVDAEVTLEAVPQSAREQVVCSVDGQMNIPLRAGDHVVVRRAEERLRLLVNPRRSFFELLRTKLRWGGR
ncbi:MAG: NAD(+)/NADH kinase, partial [Elusimicrobia bacterium]|nr:NAD(+)/NADH kinase [Elusimicrobiota bacterium]